MKEEMTRNIKVCDLLILAVVAVILVVSPAVSQDRPADNMQILRDKIKADKKLLVAENMGLTETEAKGFWPVYEAYQKDLAAINHRIAKLIDSYAESYRSGNVTDEKAQKLTAELVAIEKAEAEFRVSYVSKLSKVLPWSKIARYLQIENKIRAAVKYDLAAEIPLVP